MRIGLAAPCVPACVIALVAIAAAACNDSRKSASLTAPTPAVTPSRPNSNPVVVSSSVTRFALEGITPVTMSAVAQDPDGDALTYRWNWGASNDSKFNDSGANVTRILTGVDFDSAVVLTVTDGKGGSATATQPLAVRSPKGKWRASWVAGSSYCSWNWYYHPTMTIEQDERRLTLTMPIVEWPCGTANQIAKNDPAGPVVIDDNGAFTVRMKKDYDDIFLKAVLQTNGEISALVTYQDESGFDSVRFTKIP